MLLRLGLAALLTAAVACTLKLEVPAVDVTVCPEGGCSIIRCDGPLDGGDAAPACVLQVQP